jgi:hypothetical protein
MILGPRVSWCSDLLQVLQLSAAGMNMQNGGRKMKMDGQKMKKELLQRQAESYLNTTL